MENSIQTEVREVTIDELRKITWDYTENKIIGHIQGTIFQVYLFEVVDSGDVHLLTIQRCNVSEGWIEHIVCESYPEVENATDFFNEAKVKTDEDGDLLIERVYCDVVVNLLGAKGETILTLSKE